jgi:hypothetical protein
VNRSTQTDLEDESVALYANKDLARWFAEPSSKEYWFHIRIVGSIVELHAEHLSSEQRYVSRARRMEEAAPELLQLIRRYPPASPAAASAVADAPASVVTRAWRQASKAVSRVYSAVAG